MTKLSEVLAATKAEGRAALIGYLPAGYPSVEGSIAAARAMIEGGVDIVEVGLPYSDPQMDGPVIQQAVQVALEAGVNTLDVLRVVEGVAATGAPTLVMSYWNPIERFGSSRFAKQLAEAGGAGTILPDLIPEEAADWIAAADAQSLDRVFILNERHLRTVLETYIDHYNRERPHRGRDMELRKLCSFFRQLVHVRRRHKISTETADVAIAHVIREQEKNIGPLVGEHRAGSAQQKY